MIFFNFIPFSYFIRNGRSPENIDGKAISVTGQLKTHLINRGIFNFQKPLKYFLF